MSEKLCALRKIGGGMSETVLWSNPSPTSAFAGQDVTLNESVDNFKQIAVYYKGHKTNNNKVYYSFYDTDMFKSFTNVDQNFFGSAAMRVGSNAYVRMIYYINNTKVTFGTMYQVGGTYSNNEYIIPTKIVGLK